MTPTKIGIYVSLIVTVILGLLLSMLNLGNAQEFIIAKWAICGILSVVVAVASFVDLRFLEKPNRVRSSFRLIVGAVAIPLLVIVLAAVVLALLGADSLSERIFLQAPLLPVSLIFATSVTVHLIFIYWQRHKGQHS